MTRLSFCLCDLPSTKTGSDTLASVALCAGRSAPACRLVEHTLTLPQAGTILYSSSTRPASKFQLILSVGANFENSKVLYWLVTERGGTYFKTRE
jgi:hypothetical protein